MKKLITILLSTIFLFGPAAYAEDSSLVKEMKSLKSVDKKSFDKAMGLFIRAGKSLEEKMDHSVLVEVGRLYKEVLKVDSNYYIVEPFSKVLEKNEKAFLKGIEKSMDKKSLKKIKSNIKILKDEIKNGNG